MGLRRGLAALIIVFVSVAVAASGGSSPAYAAPRPDPGSGDSEYGRMMLVLDSSGSMKKSAGGAKTRIQAAKEALTSVVNSLPQDSDVGLRVFGAEVFSRTDRGACTDSQQIVRPGTGNRGALKKAIKKYQPYGETPIPHALREAAMDLGAEGTRAIVLVSDGESTCKPDPCKVAAEIAKAGIELRIDVVGLSVSGKARKQLKCIADTGKGTYYDADNADEIVERLSTAVRRAARPFTLTGSPIEGGDGSDPTPVTAGDWTDTLGGSESFENSKSYSFERRTPGSTIRASANMQGRKWEKLEMEIFDEGDQKCDSSQLVRIGRDTRLVLGVQVVAAAENECDRLGRHMITVTRDPYADQKPAPFQLRITEEPPVVDPGKPSPGKVVEIAKPQVSGKAKQVAGGASFDNASEIGEGRWSSNVVQGETIMYKLPLELGQAARVRTYFPKANSARRKYSGFLGNYTSVALYNPMRAQLKPPTDGDQVQNFVGGTKATSLLAGTPIVGRKLLDTRGHRGIAGDQDYSMAGDYYLGVSMAEDGGYTIEYPFSIELEILGKPAQGPGYLDDVTWSVADGASGSYGNQAERASPSPSPTDPAQAPDREPEGASAGGGSSSTWLVGLAAGLVVLGAGGAAFVVWWRKRR